MPEWHWVDDGAGGKRPSSAAYEDDPDGSPTSVTIAEESTISRCLDPVRAHAKRFAVAEFPSQAARDKGLSVRRAPTAEEPAHALMSGNKSKSVRNYLVKHSTWAHQPNAPYPPAEQPAPAARHEQPAVPATTTEEPASADAASEAPPAGAEPVRGAQGAGAHGRPAWTPGIGTLWTAALVVALLAVLVWLFA